MGKSVLIVDDSASVRQVVGMTLRGAGYTVLEASDGRDALGKLGDSRVNLVISDVNMPGMDGISFLKEMKARPANKFTPVIMLTTESGDSRKQAGKEAGARAWIVKPFQPAQLLEAVSKLVGP
ncbi:response regulator [Ectothiorhodospira marina]|uniref:Two-component system, chemotaxis family, response regulator CheY n=1 Tax=Ectothiorhodospira marina TaxID=1396821 RepID=A0A1H7FG88_9GAMM|nr:response regulator [Ectothiorhodospira marina]SEK22295.1 two-component system, chemotaxis family, response regulator CheY [Ectothiorhodospira marina]